MVTDRGEEESGQGGIDYGAKVPRLTGLLALAVKLARGAGLGVELLADLLEQLGEPAAGQLLVRDHAPVRVVHGAHASQCSW